MRELQRVQGSVALCVNLQRCLDQIEGATRVALATLANADPCAFRWWLSGRVKPTLDHLCASVTNWKFLGHAIYGIPAECRGPERLRQQNEFSNSSAHRRVIAATGLRRPSLLL